jgi:hypothetical protein
MKKQILISPKTFKALSKKLNVNTVIKNLKPNKKEFTIFIEEMVNHFKTDGWDLDKEWYISEAIIRLFGFDITDLVISEMSKRGVDVGIALKIDEKRCRSVFYIDKKKRKKKKTKSKK